MSVDVNSVSARAGIYTGWQGSFALRLNVTSSQLQRHM